MKFNVKSIIVMILLFCIQFIIAPTILNKYYPQTNEAYLVFLTTTLVVSLVAIFKVDKNILHWFLADIVYFMLIILCARNGAYGIGLNGISLDGLQSEVSFKNVLFGATLAVCVVFIIQIIIKLILKIYIQCTSK